MTTASPTHAYIIGFSDGVIKVGRTSKPTQRVEKHATEARIRRATISNIWLHETARAAATELALIACARSSLEPLVGEYFSGDYHAFFAEATRWLQRRGLLPAERCTFDEAMERYGLTQRQLFACREWEQLPTQYRMPDEPMRGYFLVDELDEWATPERLAFVKGMYRP